MTFDSKITCVLAYFFSGPDFVAFIKSRHGRKEIKESGNRKVQDCGKESSWETETLHSSEQLLRDEARNKRENSYLLPPEGWLHMDVVEREKLEWMMDVSRAPTPLRPELDKIETRFSLEGLVIPWSADVPSHLGLHHHGDEPEVSYPQ